MPKVSYRDGMHTSCAEAREPSLRLALHPAHQFHPATEPQAADQLADGLDVWPVAGHDQAGVGLTRHRGEGLEEHVESLLRDLDPAEEHEVGPLARAGREQLGRYPVVDHVDASPAVAATQLRGELGGHGDHSAVGSHSEGLHEEERQLVLA
jgi:hypothetical protein